MMKKLITVASISIAAFVPAASVISCSSSSPDYKVMDFSIDAQKCKSLNVAEFNAEPNTVNKLLKVTKQTSLDRYVNQAMDLGLFSKIQVENNYLIIQLLNKKDVNGKTVYYSYLLPNNSLTYKFKIK